jgi:transmembrane sensor
MQPTDSAALLRFINGESSASEREAVEQWMAADPSHRGEVEVLRRAWTLTAERRDAAWTVAPLWFRIQGQMAEVDTRPDAARPRSRPLVLIPQADRSPWRMMAPRLAAAAAVIAALAIGARFVGPVRADRSEVAERTVSTKAGERADLRLADGITVVLGGASTLRIPETFGTTSRELYLDGQAYFEVTPGTERGLRVHTQRSVAEDVGTRFIVMAYTGDSVEHIAVTDGIVSVRGSDSSAAPVVLHKNDVGLVSAAGRVRAQRNAGASRYLDWMNGVVHFDGELLIDAAKILERQYGVAVRIPDSTLARRRFTGSIRRESVHADLGALAALLDARYERRGDQIVLSPLRARRR